MTLVFSALLDEAWGADNTGNWQRAKELRDAGGQALDRGDFATALEQFRSAYALFPSPNLLFNIGVALDELGRAVEAINAFEDFLDGAPGAPAEARELARAHVADLDARVARLEIIAATNVAVVVDGSSIALRRARALPLIPGEHTIMAHDERGAQTSQHLLIVAGERRRITLAFELAADARPSPVPSAADVDPGAQRLGRRLRWSAIGVGTFGVCSLIVGAGLTALTISIDHQLNDGTHFDRDLLSRGERAQALEQSFFVIGGAAVATSVGLVVARWYHLRRARATIASPSARPSVSGALTFSF
jgi:hypothetical protein